MRAGDWSVIKMHGRTLVRQHDERARHLTSGAEDLDGGTTAVGSFREGVIAIGGHGSSFYIGGVYDRSNDESCRPVVVVEAMDHDRFRLWLQAEVTLVECLPNVKQGWVRRQLDHSSDRCCVAVLRSPPRPDSHWR